MEWDDIQANWRQFRASAKSQWGKLTDLQLQATAGRRNLLSSRIQDAYGTTEYETEKQLVAWQARQAGPAPAK